LLKVHPKDYLLRKFPDAKRLKGDEEIRIRCPFHREVKPSMNIIVETGVYHCFAYNTRVITDTGIEKIGDLAGKEATIINGNGEWETVSFESYGEQRLWRIDLIRNMQKKTIYTTEKHRWFVKRIKERFTSELKENYYLSARLLEMDNTKITLDEEGIKHGFIFGDGSKYTSKSNLLGSVVYFGSKEKEDMKRFFGEPGPHLTAVKKLIYTGFIIKNKKNWKELPELNSSEEYILGFLAGYFAADGCIPNNGYGTTSMSCASKTILERVKTLYQKVGIATLPIRTHSRIGIGQTEESDIHSMTLVRTTIPESFFIRKDQKESIQHYPKEMAYLRWKVVNVEETNKVEEVFCCEVPSTKSFVLEDYILTGNCFGCGKKGDFVKLYKFLEHVSWDTAKERCLRFYEKKGQAEKRFEVKMPEGLIGCSTMMSGYMTNRGFTKEDFIPFDIRFRVGDYVAFFPIHDVDGKFITYGQRGIRTGAYFYPADSPHMEYLYGEHLKLSDTVFIVEGMLDAVAIRRAGYSVLATFTQMFSNEQVKRLIQFVKDGRCKNYIIMYDAGADTQAEKLEKDLVVCGVKCGVLTLESGDPADRDIAEISDLIENYFQKKVKSIDKKNPCGILPTN